VDGQNRLNHVRPPTKPPTLTTPIVLAENRAIAAEGGHQTIVSAKGDAASPVIACSHNN
jgi:hypothetical protein